MTQQKNFMFSVVWISVFLSVYALGGRRQAGLLSACLPRHLPLSKCVLFEFVSGGVVLSFRVKRARIFWAVLATSALAANLSVRAQAPYILDLFNSGFVQEELHIPANQKIELQVFHRSREYQTFICRSLHVEKELVGEHTVSIPIGPVAAGRYVCFNGMGAGRVTIVAE